MEPDYDRHLSQQLAEYESRFKELCKCETCGHELYEGEECYYINNNYYCEDCISDFKVTLDSEDFEDSPFND